MQVKYAEGDISPGQLGQALYGLRGLGDSEASQLMLDALSKQAQKARTEECAAAGQWHGAGAQFGRRRREGNLSPGPIYPSPSRGG